MTAVDYGALWLLCFLSAPTGATVPPHPHPRTREVELIQNFENEDGAGSRLARALTAAGAPHIKALAVCFHIYRPLVIL